VIELNVIDVVGSASKQKLVANLELISFGTDYNLNVLSGKMN